MSDELLITLTIGCFYIAVALWFQRFLYAMIRHFVSKGSQLPPSVSDPAALDQVVVLLSIVWPLFSLLLVGGMLWRMLHRKR